MRSHIHFHYERFSIGSLGAKQWQNTKASLPQLGKRHAFFGCDGKPSILVARRKTPPVPARTSLLSDLLETMPRLRPQMYFKSSLVALSHAMEDLVLSGQGHPLVFACFQKERYYRQEASRYLRINAIADRVFVLAMPDTNFHRQDLPYETVGLDADDPLVKEWHLIIVDEDHTACLICRERNLPAAMDAARQFEGCWSFDPRVAIRAAQLLLPKIAAYRADLNGSVRDLHERLDRYWQALPPLDAEEIESAPFAERLMLYLQAGQYKLQRAYKAIQQSERKERTINRIATAVRQSLDIDDIFAVATQELGQALEASRCLVYRCQDELATTVLTREWVQPEVVPVGNTVWPQQAAALLNAALTSANPVQVADFAKHPLLAPAAGEWQIASWLAVPIAYRGRALGALELHCDRASDWSISEIELVQAIALHVGVALIQAESYQNLTELNRQLAKLDRAKSDLIAVTGHELRTPLSTIQVCLESLASEPDMPVEMRQVMLDTATQDAERLRNLVQDFLTLSRLESGRVEWRIEPLPARECIDLALSRLTARRLRQALPDVEVEIADDLPAIAADGEWLVEALNKLLDNACKFTPADGRIWVRASSNDRDVTQGDTGAVVQIAIVDNGRGIEPDRLEQIFDRFYQVEGSLRRTVGGTGLGLAICRLIVESLGGTIWAESEGSDRGSAFYFTIPVANPADID
ncbi:MAG: DICT sensory domain-containing protein [Cyanobacteria bacterium P01_D01_bin.123]